MPQILLLKIIRQFLVWMKSDFQAKGDSSFLVRSLPPLLFDKVDLKHEGIFLIDNPLQSPRKVEVRLGYDQKRAAEPTIHITLGSESETSQGIGLNQEWVSEQDPTLNSVRFFDHNIEIVMTSSNYVDVMILSQVLKSFFIFFADKIELSGFGPLNISIRDLQKRSDEIPPNIFARSLTLKGKIEHNISYQTISQDWSSIIGIQITQDLLP